jgi:hypothetical protein
MTISEESEADFLVIAATRRSSCLGTQIIIPVLGFHRHRRPVSLLRLAERHSWVSNWSTVPYQEAEVLLPIRMRSAFDGRLYRSSSSSNPLRGCNTDLARYSHTPILRVAGFEDSLSDEAQALYRRPLKSASQARRAPQPRPGRSRKHEHEHDFDAPGEGGR